MNNLERRREESLRWQCPAGSYPCNGSTSTGALCVERHRWCDHVVDCPNEEDEDPEHCRQYQLAHDFEIDGPGDVTKIANFPGVAR